MSCLLRFKINKNCFCLYIEGRVDRTDPAAQSGAILGAIDLMAAAGEDGGSGSGEHKADPPSTTRRPSRKLGR